MTSNTVFCFTFNLFEYFIHLMLKKVSITEKYRLMGGRRSVKSSFDRIRKKNFETIFNDE